MEITNILYRDISDLALNYINLKDRIIYYQDNIFDNVYYTDNAGKYLGFYNAKIDRIKGVMDTSLFFDATTNIDFIKNFFFSNPNIYRVPIISNEKLIGEYYNNNSIGRSLLKQIEDTSLSLMPIFQNYIHNWSKDKVIKLLCTDDKQQIFENLFCNISNNKYDFIIDTIYTDDFRHLVLDFSKNYVSLSNILITILVTEIVRYFKEKSVSFYIVKGVRKSYPEINSQFTDKEKSNTKKSLEEVLSDSEYINILYKDDEASRKYVENHKNDISQLSRIVSNGIHNYLLDRREDGFNIINGKRITTGHPYEVSQTIHMFGPCIVQGLCVSDSQTIASILQRKINENGFQSIQVVNNGLAYGKDLLNDLLYMLGTNFNKGDIVIWINGYSNNELELFKNNNIEIIDCNSCFIGQHDWFCNIPFHCTSKANQIFSNQIFDCIRNELQINFHSEAKKGFNFLLDRNISLKFNSDNILNSYEMNLYMKYITKHKKSLPKNTKIGSIVINANPCTKGHIYLITEALKQVDFLYIFLVEGNKHGFDYLDRETMLLDNLIGFTNVCVLSGGAVMTSELCFPEYFNRNIDYKKINPALHLKIFGQKIASFLEIKYRFFGEEPEDYITRELNKVAQQDLQQYGVEAIFIPRTEYEIGNPISAKKVRKYFEERNYKELVKLVPFPTYKKLLEINNDLNEDNLKYYTLSGENNIINYS